MPPNLAPPPTAPTRNEPDRSGAASRRRPWRSIRVQTALLFGGLAVLLCGVLALALGSMLAREIRDDNARALDVIAQTAARTLANGLEDRLRETLVLASAPELWAQGLDSAAAAQALARSQSAQPNSTWIGVADASGRVLAATGGMLVGRNVAQRPWFGRGLQGAYVGDVHRAELLETLLPKSGTGEPIRFVDFAAPIVVNGRTVGVLGVHGTWAWSREVVTALMPADAAAHALEVFIFDRAGHPLYAPHGTAAAAALPAASGSPVMTWDDGQAYLTSIATLPARSAVTDLGWRIAAREPVDLAFARAHDRARQAFVLGLAVALLAGGLAWSVSGLITRPLVSIAHAARDVEHGVAGARIPLLDGNEELQQLSVALTGMTNRLNATIQTAPVGICQVDLDGVVLTTNRRLCEILGCDGDALPGRPLGGLIAEPDRDVADDALRRLRSAELDTVSHELRLVRHRDGREFCASLSASLVRQAGGETPYFIVVVEDITRRKEGEAAERANAAKTAFLSQVSHELRTPLNAVLGFSQLMQMDGRDPLSAQQSSRIKTIVGAGKHLLAMIDDLLDLSQIDAGRLSMSPEPVSLPAVVEQCVVLLADAARLSHVELALLPPAAEASNYVRADHVRLRQVLVNLLSNAIKYNRPGGTVSVGWAAGTDEGTIALTVTDTGHGLSAEKLARLFEPFNRLGAEASAVQGTGIGLVITRKLVEMMGGSLSVSSAPGVGSCFTVLLPIGVARRHGVARSTDFGALQDAPSRSRTVLYVEDNELNIQLVTAALQMRPNCRLLVARSGREALAMAPGLNPDLFLLDMHLGDMTGLELARRLESLPQFASTPFIALSADVSPAAIDTAIEAGFRDYLTKPLDLRKLVGCLESA